MKQLILFALVIIFNIQPALSQNISTKSASYSFIENKGQVADGNGKPQPDILFTTGNGNVKMFLTKTGLHYQWEKMHNPATADAKHDYAEYSRQLQNNSLETYRLDVELVGANPNPHIEKYEPSEDYVNYYLAHCAKGITGVKHFAKVVYKNVYPGIDWIWYNKNGQVKYDFVVNPGADYKQIKLRINGAENSKLLEDGGLKITTPLGELNEKAPVSFINNQKTASHFIIQNNVVSFSVPMANKNHKLVIDPLLIWSTYYGGDRNDQGYSVAVHDSTGDVYMTGVSSSPGNIYFNGFLNKTVSPLTDAILVKFNAAGKRLWATYYGGAGSDLATSVAVDNRGNCYIGGTVRATDSIAYNGHQNTHGGGADDAFLAKFDKAGMRLWATYYGGTGADIGNAVATNGIDVFLAGNTKSTNDIAAGGPQATLRGVTDGFLVKFDSAGTRKWATYFGGNGVEDVFGLAVNVGGQPVMSGETNSNAFIATTFGHQKTLGGSTDAYVVKFHTNGAIIWGTYYGGTAADEGNSIALDAADNVYLAGTSYGNNNISTPGTYQTTLNGSRDAFLVKFSSNGGRQWGTYFGGEGTDDSRGIALNKSNEIYIAGRTGSSTGIALNSNTTKTGSTDIFLTRFSTSGVPLWGTYFGGVSTDFVLSVACGTQGATYISGYASSTDSISFHGHQDSLMGLYDAFLTKFLEEESISPGPFSDAPICGKVDYRFVANKPSQLFKCRWYKDTTTNWFYEGDTLDITLTSTDTIWAELYYPKFNFTSAKTNVVITILPLPIASFTAPAAGCFNRKVQFTTTSTIPSGTLSHRWEFGNGITDFNANPAYTYTKAGTYTVLLTATSDKFCSDTISRVITIYPTPVTPVINGITTAHVGYTEPYSATSNTGSKYHWTITGGTKVSGDSTNSIQVQWGYGTSGSVQLIEKSPGCESDPVTKTVSLMGTSVNEVGGSPVKVYPNPARDEFTISAMTEGIYTITDITGRKIKDGIITANTSKNINCNEMAAGTYLLSFTTGNKEAFTTKIVIY